MIPQTQFSVLPKFLDYYTAGLGWKVEEGKLLIKVADYIPRMEFKYDLSKDQIRLPGGCGKINDFIEAIKRKLDQVPELNALEELCKELEMICSYYENDPNRLSRDRDKEKEIQNLYFLQAEGVINKFLSPEQIEELLASAKIETLRRKYRDETDCTFKSSKECTKASIGNHTKTGYLLFGIEGSLEHSGSSESEIRRTYYMEFAQLDNIIFNGHRIMYRGLLRKLADYFKEEKKHFALMKEIDFLLK